MPHELEGRECKTLPPISRIMLRTIAAIAVIARHRRDREKPFTLPLMDADKRC